MTRRCELERDQLTKLKRSGSVGGHLRYPARAARVSPTPAASRWSSTWSRTSAARRTSTPTRARCRAGGAVQSAHRAEAGRHGRACAGIPRAVVHLFHPQTGERTELICSAPEFRLRAPTPGLVALPWDRPLSEWVVPDVPLRDIAVGMSRHLVKFVDADDALWAVKDMPPRVAVKEYDVLRSSRTWGCPRCARRVWCCSPSSTPRSWSPATSRGPGSTAGCSCVCRPISRSTARDCWTRWRACWWNCIATASSGATVRWRTPCSRGTGSFCRPGWSTPRPPRCTRR